MNGNEDYLQAFKQLNLMISVMQAHIMRHVHENKDPVEMAKRADALTQQVTSLIKEIPGSMPETSAGNPNPCGPWFDCNGICQPWPC